MNKPSNYSSMMNNDEWDYIAEFKTKSRVRNILHGILFYFLFFFATGFAFTGFEVFFVGAFFAFEAGFEGFFAAAFFAFAGTAFFTAFFAAGFSSTALAVLINRSRVQPAAMAVIDSPGFTSTTRSPFEAARLRSPASSMRTDLAAPLLMCTVRM
jgi:hypothetical protein